MVSFKILVENTWKSDNAFFRVSAHIPGSYIGAPIEYAIHEINALREGLWQRVGKFLLKSIIALWKLWTYLVFGIWFILVKSTWVI